jgi:hypothetical protein
MGAGPVQTGQTAVEARKQNTPRNHKGFLNRRFKRVFAYFCRGAKVGEESGGEKPPGRFEKNPPFAAGGGEEKRPLKSIVLYFTAEAEDCQGKDENYRQKSVKQEPLRRKGK